MAPPYSTKRQTFFFKPIWSAYEYLKQMPAILIIRPNLNCQPDSKILLILRLKVIKPNKPIHIY